MGTKILIIDDEEVIHKTVKRVLESEPLEISSAYNGEEGLEAAKKIRPALILLDVNMPKMDGYGVMKNLRSANEIKSTPVLMLTANGDPVDKMVGYELGVEDYVTKPFQVDELKKRVKNLLK